MSSEICQKLLKLANKEGATSADVIYRRGEYTEVRVRGGKAERQETAISDTIGLRVIVDNSQAVGTTSRLHPHSLEQLAKQLCAMAKVSPKEPHAKLAGKSLWAEDIVAKQTELDLYDNFGIPHADKLQDIAIEVEEAGLAVAKVSKSDSAWASGGDSSSLLATSSGFEGSYNTTSYSFGAEMIAGSGNNMVTSFDYISRRHFADLGSPAEIGRCAGEKVARKIGAKPIKGGKMPVVYEYKAARALLSAFTGAINGSSIVRGTSFLKDCIDKQIFSTTINIIDNPHMKRGLGSKPFDGEGVANKCRDIVKNGILQTWFLDITTASKLGLETTGHASRSVGSLPHPSCTNLYMEAGEITPANMLSNIKDGLYITSTIGGGVNSVTGDYSIGAEGFRIENGVLTTPVHEVTLAGNLKDMFKNITPASDLVFDSAISTPTLLIEGMTVAGR